MKKALWIILCLLLTACGVPSTVTPVPTTATNVPTVTSAPTGTPVTVGTLEPTRTRIPTATDTAVPSRTTTLPPTGTATHAVPSATPTVAPSTTPSRTPSRAPTATITAGPTSVPGYAQQCATLAARGTIGIFILYIDPEPELVWDNVPRQFKVGLCNTLPPPSVPQGRYKVVLSFPGGNRGSASSSEVHAELHPGQNEVSIGPWIPGLENHQAICATRAVAQTQVMYNDSPEPVFHPLPWVDGRTEIGLPIKCGGDYS